ncbi:MAG: PHP domain-containing protein [Bacteroidales bacterium]|jgi:PHP family Zn ribbon phosphoesterase|nr:PHP domain-containing protein [Bacteroidales bacterium]
MKLFKADLHTHTVLSPCGDLEMSPLNIILKAKEKGIDILGITDHNSTKNCKVLEEVAEEYDLFILKGTEVNTREEAHCLAFFESDDELSDFQQYIDEHLPNIKNDIKKFGYQVVVDKDENILEHVDRLLISALDVSIEQIEKKVHELHGIFIPAHIDRSRYSIISQLGFVPGDLNFDALELSKFVSGNDFVRNNGYLADYPLIQSSDAHFLENIGDCTTGFYLQNRSFDEVRQAFKKENNRKIILHE